MVTTNEKKSESVLKQIKDENIQYVDLRFTDPRGKLQHLTIDSTLIDETFFTEGTMFDGSSISGWKTIDNSDMCLMADVSTATMDPFYAQPTLTLFCDVTEPSTGAFYNRDPRSTAKRAEKYLQSTGIGDTAYFGPELEFFIFDDVRYFTDPYNTGFALDGTELPINSGTDYDAGNMGHRPLTKGGYFPINPVDSCQDLRSEMLTTMKEMGLKVEKHHHEVAPGQHELGLKFNQLTQIADSAQLYKYVVHNVAHAYGKTATFMPKPVYGDNGTGMHCHQSIWKDGKPVFAGDKYAGLSQDCLYYIGGIIKHARALNALTNASTNSYKRLLPGFEAPVILAYSASNRSASCRIPFVTSPAGKRVEIRFPDPTANPYLAFSAMLMAGLDGIQNKIDPGAPMDQDLYELSAEELKKVPQVCGSFREALDALDRDRNFLTKGGVMDEDQITAYIELKMQEVYRWEHLPHPVEFQMYYSV